MTTRLLSAFTGFAGMQTCPPDPCLYHQTTSQPALLDEAPTLNTIILTLSKDLPPLALAQCLARARFSYWSDDHLIFPIDVRTAKAS